MAWSQGYHSQPHPEYPLLARTIGPNPQHEDRPCCLCYQVIGLDIRTLTHSQNKCSNTFHEECFTFYNNQLKVAHGEQYKSPCPWCGRNLGTEHAATDVHMPEGISPREAARHANIALGVYVQLMKTLWYDMNPGRKRRDPHSSKWNLESTSGALTNELRSLLSQILAAEGAFKAKGLLGIKSRIPTTWFGDEKDAKELEAELEAEEQQFSQSPLAFESAAALNAGIPTDLEWEVEYLITVFVDFFTNFDYQVDVQRQQGDPMQDDPDGDEYHTSIEWAGEIHGFCAATNFGFNFKEGMTRGKENLLENRIRERLARYLVIAHVFRRNDDDDWTEKETALDIDKRVCAFLARMEGEYDNSIEYGNEE